MTPTRETFDLNKIYEKLSALELKQMELNGKLENVIQTQGSMHAANQREIVEARNDVKALDVVINGNEDAPGLRMQMNTLVSYGKATAFWGKIIAFLLTLLLGYATWREARHGPSGSMLHSSAPSVVEHASVSRPSL